MKTPTGLKPTLPSRKGMSLCLSVVLGLSVLGCSGPSVTENDAATLPPESAELPNIMMILLDDLGYSDLAPYGGDAQTPVMDALARDGVQFSNFHSYPVCAPTRAALMTGQEPHRVGLGAMEGLAPPGVPRTTPGYSGSLEGDYTGIAQVLADSGYSTYQVGKWHLGEKPGQTPRDLGFDRNYTLFEGGASHYSDALGLAYRGPSQDTVHYERDGQRIDTLPDEFYSSHSYTDEMLRMLEVDDPDRPFFGYLAYTAVHDPLHLPNQELIDSYLERYLDQNDVRDLRSERIGRLAERGLIDGEVATRWVAQTPDWNTLSDKQRRDLAYRMAVYAAMIEDVDDQIGRVVDHLEKIGEYENTLIVVASDNGAAGASRLAYNFLPGAEEWQEANFPGIGDMDTYGEQGSYPTLGLPNAQVSNGPYFHTKATVFEGGTRVPAIVKTPGRSGQDVNRPVEDTFTQIGDLYPTFADYANASMVDSNVLVGNSMKPLLSGEADQVGVDEFAMESFGHRAFWDGDWKLVYAPEISGGTGRYALFDLSSDPGETHDLADQQPEVVNNLAKKWDQYASANGVVPVDFESVNADAARSNALMYKVDWVE